jgi:hypothetical protein
VRLGRILLVAGSLAFALSACGGQPRRGPPPKVIDQVLRGAPGVAQPSTIVATEVAFGRLASETNQSAAFLQYAAAGAQVHTPAGLVPAQQWLVQSGSAAGATQWKTRAVAIACNGALAASTGRYTDPAGIIGNYVMVWQRQGDGSYRWLYHAAGPDVPQPPPRAVPEDGDIVVTALDAVQGLIASCPRGGADIPPPPAVSLAGEAPGDATLSRDGTLRWRWEQPDAERKFIAAEYFYEGRWLIAFELSLPSSLDQ